MVSTEESSTRIRFEGIGGIGTEIWGGTQANFLITRPNQHAEEVAVMLYDPAAVLLADLLKQDDTQEFRDQAARHIGSMWLERLMALDRPIGMVVPISVEALNADPEFLVTLKQSLTS